MLWVGRSGRPPTQREKSPEKPIAPVWQPGNRDSTMLHVTPFKMLVPCGTFKLWLLILVLVCVCVCVWWLLCVLCWNRIVCHFLSGLSCISDLDFSETCWTLWHGLLVWYLRSDKSWRSLKLLKYKSRNVEGKRWLESGTAFSWFISQVFLFRFHNIPFLVVVRHYFVDLKHLS